LKGVPLDLKLKSIKAVFFDFGDTLVSLTPPKEELFLRAAVSIGLKLDIESVRMAYRIVDFCHKYSSLRITDLRGRDDFYRKYNKKLCAALGISSCFSDLHPLLLRSFKDQKRWELIEDVPQVIRSLDEAGIPLAIVANWDRALASLVEKLGILELFSSIVSSQEVGAEKPDPEIFNKALNDVSLSVENDLVLYVGNDYQLDIQSARTAGLIPVLIDRCRDYLHADCMRFDSMEQWFEHVK